jgi:hypothetical protein
MANSMSETESREGFHGLLTLAEITDIVATASALLRSPGLCAALMLFPSIDDGERSESCSVVVQGARTAVRDVLLRIDDHFHDNVAARLHFRDTFVRLLAPIVEGLWHLGVRDEPPNGFVILAVESEHVSNRHSGFSVRAATVESASPSA